MKKKIVVKEGSIDDERAASEESTTRLHKKGIKERTCTCALRGRVKERGRAHACVCMHANNPT